MNRKTAAFRTLLIGVAALCAACSDGNDPRPAQGEGKLKIHVTADGSTVSASSARAAQESATRTEQTSDTPEAADFGIAILQGEEVVQEWEKFSQYPDEAIFPVGSYTLRATYGDLINEGFAQPCFTGEQAFAIADEQTTQVSLTCRLANVKVTAEYSEAFREYFSDFTTRVNSQGNSPVVFDADETRAAYFKPGRLTATIEVTKADGGATSTFEAAVIDDALARHHYRLKFDVNAGKATMSVTFSDDVEEVPLTINVSDESMRTDPPVMIAHGFTADTPLDVKEGSTPTQPVSIYLNARAGIKSCVLTTTGTTLLANGWPAEMDLTALTTEQAEKVAEYRLKTAGLGANKENIATIDFTPMLPFIEENTAEGGNSLSTFSVKLTDQWGKVSETPLNLIINTLGNGFSASAPEAMPIGATTFDIPVTLDGDISTVTARYWVSGTWNPLTFTVKESSGSSHILTATLPQYLSAASKMEVICGKKTKELALALLPPKFSVTAAPADVWATRATVRVEGENEATTAYVRNRKLTLQVNNGSSWTTPANQTVTGGIISVSGLPANTAETTYQIKVLCQEDGTDATEYASEESSFTTEAALQVPNADMDEWNVENQRNLAKGALDGLNKTTYYAYNPNSDQWATTNTKTFNHGSNYAINAYPSVVNESRGTDDNAAVIRSIGWVEGSGNSYEGITGNVCKEWSVGKLFLGSYAFSIDTYTDTYNYGIPFASRPSSLEFEYKYDSYNNDRFKIWAVVENRENGTVTELARQELTGGAKAAFTKETIRFSYTDTSKKATHFYIVFASSEQCSDNYGTENAAMKEKALLHVIDSSYWGGSVLVIDNILLNY